MFGQILVPLDGTELAERALPCAERLARIAVGRVHLVRVLDVMAQAAWAPIPTYVPDDLYAREQQEVQAYLAAQRERVAAAGVAVQTAALEGNVGAALLDYEREAAIDLVVMCSHGRSGLARFALGSVAERLLRYGAAPLLLVRAFGAPVALEHAVVPLDGSTRAEQALEVIEHLAGSVVREVTLLRMIERPDDGPAADDYLAAVAHRLPEGLTVHRRVEQGDPAERIIAVTGSDGFVVMATHGRIGLARWALGSVADRVAHGGVAGLLLLRSREVDKA